MNDAAISPIARVFSGVAAARAGGWHRPDPRFPAMNVGAGQQFHNGDFGTVYGDELRLGVEVRCQHLGRPNIESRTPPDGHALPVTCPARMPASAGRNARATNRKAVRSCCRCRSLTAAH